MSFQEEGQSYPFEEEIENILTVWAFFGPMKTLHKRSTVVERRVWLDRYSVLLHNWKSEKCNREQNIQLFVDNINETRCEICRRIRWFCQCEGCRCVTLREERDQHIRHWQSEAAMVRVVGIIVTMLSKSLNMS